MTSLRTHPICGPLCQHPGCWEAARCAVRDRNRKSEVSNLKRRASTFNSSRKSTPRFKPDPDDDLPTQAVVNLLDDYGYDPNDRYPTVKSAHYKPSLPRKVKPIEKKQKPRVQYSPHSTPRVKEKPPAAPVSQVHVQEVFEFDELQKSWEDTFQPKKYYVWVPNPNRRPRNPLEFKQSQEIKEWNEPGPTQLPSKDMTDQLMPKEIEVQRELLALQKRSARMREGTGKSPFVTSAHASHGKPTYYGVYELLDLPRDVLKHVLDHMSERDFLDRNRFAKALLEALPDLERHSSAVALAQSQVLKQSKLPVHSRKPYDRGMSAGTLGTQYILDSDKDFQLYSPDAHQKRSHDFSKRQPVPPIGQPSRPSRLAKVSLGLPEMLDGPVRPFKYDKVDHNFSLVPMSSPPQLDGDLDFTNQLSTLRATISATSSSRDGATEESIQLKPPRNTPNFLATSTPSPIKAFRAARDDQQDIYDEDTMQVPMHTPYTGRPITEYTEALIQRFSTTDSDESESTSSNGTNASTCPTSSAKSTASKSSESTACKHTTTSSISSTTSICTTSTNKCTTSADSTSTSETVHKIPEVPADDSAGEDGEEEEEEESLPVGDSIAKVSTLSDEQSIYESAAFIRNTLKSCLSKVGKPPDGDSRQPSAPGRLSREETAPKSGKSVRFAPENTMTTEGWRSSSAGVRLTREGTQTKGSLSVAMPTSQMTQGIPSSFSSRKSRQMISRDTRRTSDLCSPDEPWPVVDEEAYANAPATPPGVLAMREVSLDTPLRGDQSAVVNLDTHSYANTSLARHSSSKTSLGSRGSRHSTQSTSSEKLHRLQQGNLPPSPAPPPPSPEPKLDSGRDSEGSHDQNYLPAAPPASVQDSSPLSLIPEGQIYMQSRENTRRSLLQSQDLRREQSSVTIPSDSITVAGTDRDFGGAATRTPFSQFTMASENDPSCLTPENKDQDIRPPEYSTIKEVTLENEPTNVRLLQIRVEEQKEQENNTQAAAIQEEHPADNVQGEEGGATVTAPPGADVNTIQVQEASQVEDGVKLVSTEQTRDGESAAPGADHVVNIKHVEETAADQQVSKQAVSITDDSQINQEPKTVADDSQTITTHENVASADGGIEDETKLVDNIDETPSAELTDEMKAASDAAGDAALTSGFAQPLTAAYDSDGQPFQELSDKGLFIPQEDVSTGQQEEETKEGEGQVETSIELDASEEVKVQLDQFDATEDTMKEELMKEYEKLEQDKVEDAS